MAIRLQDWDGSDPDYEALVEAFREGSTVAFETIFARTSPRLLGQARRRLGSAAEAEDAVQETFERALRGMDRFGLQGDFRMAAWLARILANVCHDRSASLAAGRRASERVGVAPDDAPDVADAVVEGPLSRELHQALDALPPAHRRALWLRVVEDMDYGEVASRTGTTEENARARVHRARRAMRRRLGYLGAALGIAFGVILSRVGRRSRFEGTMSSGVGSANPVILTNQYPMVLANQIVAHPWSQAAVASVGGASRGTLVMGAVAAAAAVSAGGLAVVSAPAPSPRQAVTAKPLILPTPTTAPPTTAKGTASSVPAPPAAAGSATTAPAAAAPPASAPSSVLSPVTVVPAAVATLPAPVSVRNTAPAATPPPTAAPPASPTITDPPPVDVSTPPVLRSTSADSGDAPTTGPSMTGPSMTGPSSGVPDPTVAPVVPPSAATPSQAPVMLAGR